MICIRVEQDPAIDWIPTAHLVLLEAIVRNAKPGPEEALKSNASDHTKWIGAADFMSEVHNL